MGTTIEPDTPPPQLAPDQERRLRQQDRADNTERMLRGKAMECISLIGVAVGVNKFGADAKEVMETLIRTQVA